MKGIFAKKKNKQTKKTYKFQKYISLKRFQSPKLYFRPLWVFRQKLVKSFKVCQLFFKAGRDGIYSFKLYTSKLFGDNHILMVVDIKTFMYILGRMRTGKLVQKARGDETHRRPTGYQGSMCWMVIVYDEKMQTQGRSPAMFQQLSKPSGPLQIFHI